MSMDTFGKMLAEILVGACAGSITAAGLFAVISSVGIINRIADVSNTKEYLLFYEEVTIIGAVLGNIVWIFDVHMPLGQVGVLLYGLLSGMFIGLFLVSLAETIKGLPVFIRRVRIGTGLGVVVVAIALGKLLGHIIYYFKLY